jgi:hypothetical protein
MQIALGATVLLLIVWFLALRPKSPTAEETAVAPVTPAQEAPTAPPVDTEPETAAPTRAERRAAARAATRPRPGDTAAVRNVRAALRDRKAIAIAFITPTVADARAVDEEIQHVSNFGGRAVTFSVPISDLSRYGFITRGVDVTVAPTTIVVAPNREATTIVGFADRFEIEQRLADALR